MQYNIYLKYTYLILFVKKVIEWDKYNGVEIPNIVVVTLLQCGHTTEGKVSDTAL